MNAQAPHATGRQALFANLLFWGMLLVGGGALAACMLVPAWLDYQAARQAAWAAHARNDALARRITAQQLQIAHHQRDPQYNERFIRQEFRIPTPGVQVVTVEADPTGIVAPADDAERAHRPAEPVFPAKALATARRSPLLAVFVLDQTRPAVMALAGALLTGALCLISGPRRS
ncbi:MAG: hypothetical protein D6744_18950 [Planctomycetota bacterium]|nr:MAG: hypothetical protein D6744_18950 [Planctomycetota bacterium]